MNPQRKYPFFVLFTLFLLYLSQGLPTGFQHTGLTIYMREHGSSLTQIGFAGLLGLPWMFKLLWAPLIDHFYWSKFGRRRSWIVPLQILFATTLLTAAWITRSTDELRPLLVCIFFMNLFASMQDIPVDGLAIDTLKPHALGLGNIAQVVGFKTGVVLAGGVLLAISSTMDWSSLFASIALITTLPLIATLFLRERPLVIQVDELTEPAEKPSFKEILRRTLGLITGPQTRWAVLFILTYKLGEDLIGKMFTALLVDNGITREQIGAWVGTYGMAASIGGSILGGVLIVRYRIWTILGAALLLRLIPLTMQWWLTHSAISHDTIILSTIAEHITGGMLTTATFAFMMSLVNKRVGASEYTLLASLEVIGKSPSSFAGLLADTIGFAPLFLLGLVLATATLIPWWKCREIQEGSTTT